MTDKQHARLLESAAVLKKFCEINNIPKPKIAFFDSSRSGNCGYYQWRSKVLCIDPNACAREVANPAMRNWSHPHYFTDRTVYGVLHHEARLHRSGIHKDTNAEGQRRLKGAAPS